MHAYTVPLIFGKWRKLAFLKTYFWWINFSLQTPAKLWNEKQSTRSSISFLRCWNLCEAKQTERR
jgi:hypothetical protein